MPSKVRSLTMLDCHRSFMTLKWSAVEHNGFPVEEARVRWSPVEAMDGATEAAHVRGAATQCPVTHLAKGRTYFFQVAAVNALGMGPWSDPLRIAVAARTEGALTDVRPPPPPPKRLVVREKAQELAITA